MERSDELILKMGSLCQLKEAQEQIRRRKEEESLALYEELKALGSFVERKEWDRKIEELLIRVNHLEERWGDVERELFRKIESVRQQIRDLEV